MSAVSCSFLAELTRACFNCADIDPNDLPKLGINPSLYPSVKDFLPPPPPRIDVLVIGSSVASGWGVSQQGWAFRLETALERNYQMTMENASDYGANTAKALAQVKGALEEHNPHVVLIALSAANEKLYDAKDADAIAAVEHRFLTGLQSIAAAVVAKGCSVIFGGVYPNNRYTPDQYECLKRIDETMRSWEYPVIPFLEAMDDGYGHWNEPPINPGHPSGKGHKMMFMAIDQSLFPQAKAQSIQGAVEKAFA